MENTGMTTSEALLLSERNRDDYGFGGMWFWVIILLVLFNGGGIFGGATMDGTATREAVTTGFQYNQLDNGIRSLQNGLCDSTYALTTAIKDCCCATQRAIDGVRYDMSRGFCDIVTASNLNTRDILEAQNAGVQRIIDYMCNNEKQALRQEISALQLSAALQNQTASLVGQLRPVATPAYLTASPYTSFPLNGFGYGYGCGCGI